MMGEGLVQGLSLQVSLAAVHSKAVVLVLLIHQVDIVAPIVCGGSVFGPCFFVM